MHHSWLVGVGLASWLLMGCQSGGNGAPTEGEGTPVGEGEGEGAPVGEGEGEGAPVGEGEGTPVGEGEGEGTPVGEGEGEGTPVGEGEGEGQQVGEGEGEGATVGEGEGEGTPVGEGEGAAVGEGEGEGEGGIDPATDPEQLVRLVAEATCEALARCCNEADRDLYFAGYGARAFIEGDERGPLADFAARLPPQHTPTIEECPALLGELLELLPFGPWVAQVRLGRVTYRAEEASRCLETLRAAACGPALGQALYDGTCLALEPPGGGQEQRRMFVRTAPPGDPCVTLNDGVGAAFYGTCDPFQGFCCAADPRGCTLVRAGEEGICAATSPEGEACSVVPLQLCATGMDCDMGTGRCRVPLTGPLAVGVACLDEFFNPLGECQASWCDHLGSGQCEPLREDGAPCQTGVECRSGACPSGQCGPSTFCQGVALR